MHPVPTTHAPSTAASSIYAEELGTTRPGVNDDLGEYRLGPSRETLARLFRGRTKRQQQCLLAELELAGARLYQDWAARSRNGEERSALRKAAGRAENNAELLMNLSKGRT